MTHRGPSAPGFAIPPEGAHQHAYAPVQHQPGYPPVHQHAYPSQQPTYPAHQQPPQHPFGTPLQQPPNYIQPQPIQWNSGNFQTYLTGATTFYVKQKVELLEVLVGWETGNKYSVKDQAGNQVFFVGEESTCLSRICCGRIRPFQLIVKDNRGQTVMEFSRGVDCGSLCFACLCADEVKVTAQGGQFLGSVGEECSILYPCFKIKDSMGQTVLRIEGPICATSLFCGAVEFQVFDMAGNQVGTIKKEWGGVVREMFTDADTFSISFPANIDPAIKAVLLGALFMIDFHYFEDGKGRRKLFS